jgi:hypothetical protein
MQTKTLRDLKRLIELLEVTSSDTLNIATAILRNNSEINLPELSELRQAFTLSLSAKTNRELSLSVKNIRVKLIESLLQKIDTIESPSSKLRVAPSLVLSSLDNMSIT